MAKRTKCGGCGKVLPKGTDAIVCSAECRKTWAEKLPPELKKGAEKILGAFDAIEGHSPQDLAARFYGMAVGERMEWTDHWVEAEWRNTLCNDRRLAGTLKHIAHTRWGTSVRVVLDRVPDGDSLKIGQEVMRFEDSIFCGNIQRALDA